MTVGSIPGMGSIPNLPGSRFFLMTEATTLAPATTLARSNKRTPGHRIQPPGVTQRAYPPSGTGRALPGGPSELTPTVTEVIFVRALFLPLCYNCTNVGVEQAQRHKPASLSSESGESLRHVGCYPTVVGGESG